MSIILITGSTDGIGLATARQLARQGHELALHGRTADKAQQACDTVRQGLPRAKLHSCHADLSSLSEVARMAEDLNARLPRLDVLINNAGVYLTTPQLSQNGYEMTWAINHLAHFLLTLRLLPLLKKSSEPRVVTMSSMVHSDGRIHLAGVRSTEHYEAYHAYANSKLANALFARELARREPWLTSNSLHPGVINTKLLHAAFSIQGSDVSEGARISVLLATSPEVKGISGKYFDHDAVVAAARQVEDVRLARQLWAWSEQAVLPWLQTSKTF